MSNRIYQDARKFVDLAKNSGTSEQSDAISKAKNALCLPMPIRQSQKKNNSRSTKRVRWTFLMDSEVIRPRPRSQKQADRYFCQLVLLFGNTCITT